MILLDQVALSDGYTESNTVLSLNASKITLFVEGNACKLRTLKRSVRGAQNYDPMPEQTIKPGIVTIDNAVGVALKNAFPGNIARVTLVVPEYDEQYPGPIISGFTPNTVQLDASDKLVVPAWTTVTGTLNLPTTGTYDVSGFAFLTGFIGLDPGSIGTGELTFLWYADADATQIVGVQGFPLTSLIPSTAQLLIPNLGPFLKIQFVKFSGTTKLGCRLFGTNRTGNLPLVPGDSMLHTFTNRALAAATTETSYPADYFAGPVRIYFRAPVGWSCTFYAYDLTLVTYPFDVVNGAGANPVVATTIAPLGAWLVVVFNSTGVAGTYDLTTVPSTTGAG